MSDSGVCKVYQGDFIGWNAYFWENEYVRLAVTPDIGGRIMAYDLDDFPYIYVEREWAVKLFSLEENQGDGSLAAWKNHGGAKTWPARSANVWLICPVGHFDVISSAEKTVETHPATCGTDA
jgi:hypothetical protein